MMSSLRGVVLCADDFAQSEGISSAIMELAGRDRLSAVSCLCDAPQWPQCGQSLRELADRIDVGLHFNLTQDYGFGEKPLSHWLADSVFGRIDGAAISAALDRQIDRFIEVFGRLPDFIDGHQHVHSFPVIRHVVAEKAEEIGADRRIYVRDVSHFWGATDASIKRLVIRSFARLGRSVPAAKRARSNSCFSGDYSLSTQANYSRLMNNWLATAPDRALIMCHPGPVADADGLDAIAAARAHEYRFLAGEAFAGLLARHGIELCRGSDLFLPASGPEPKSKA